MNTYTYQLTCQTFVVYSTKYAYLLLFPYSISFTELKNQIETQVNELKTQIEGKCVMQ